MKGKFVSNLNQAVNNEDIWGSAGRAQSVEVVEGNCQVSDL